jgi:pimeloyl-ACP methyl ester carboxylesterase
MCEEVAESVTDHLVPDCGHWVAEEQPAYFTKMFCEFDAAARVGRGAQASQTILETQ